MVGGVTRLDGDENAPARSREVAAGGQFHLYVAASFLHAGGPRYEREHLVEWRGGQQLDLELSRNRAWRSADSASSHERVRGRPVAVTIQECTDDATVQHTGKRLVVRFGLERGDQLLALHVALKT